MGSRTASVDYGRTTVHYVAATALGGGVAAVDHHVLDDAAAGASECRRRLILRGLEAGDALLERGELDHDEAMEVVRSFVDVIPAAARQDPAAVLGDDCRHEVRTCTARDP